MIILEVQGLIKVYGSGATAVRALDGVNLTVERGEFLAVVGSSGSGKTTLLNMIGGLDVPTEGMVIVDGKALEALDDEAFIMEVVQVLGLKDKLKCHPNMLSGGQQQRVAIARALAIKPAIILADEPTGNLDSRTSQDVLGLLKMTGERYRQTIVMITHNEEIAQLADRIIRIEDGRCVEGGV